MGIGFKVIFYEKPDGGTPVEDFIIGQDNKMKAKIVGMLELLEERGNSLREPYSKHLEDGIFEIRCQVGNNITRILYFFYHNGTIVMTNGFVKKTQRTPIKELLIAKKYRAEYYERMNIV